MLVQQLTFYKTGRLPSAVHPTAFSSKSCKTRRKARIFFILILLLICFMTGCQTVDGQLVSSEQAFYSFTDSLGRQVTLQNRPQRVAAISGSYADTWILAGGDLAATTQDAWDEEEFSLPENVVNIGSIKTPSIEAILKNKIDFVLLSSKIEEHVKLRDQLEKLSIPCAYFEVEVFSDYLNMLKICTDITGRADLYQKKGTDIQAKIDVAVARKEGEEPPTVLFLRAYSTGVRAKNSDNMTGAMLKELGCVNIADWDGALLENLSLESIIKQNPDFIFFVTMGASEEKALDSMRKVLEENPVFRNLSAVKKNRYIQLPKNLFHLKPNSRWGESYGFLADILYEKSTQ